MKEAKDCITGVIVTPHKIISSSLDGCIRQYDIRAGELTSDKIGEPITHICLTRDEQCILAACSDDVIRLVDLDGGEILLEYKGHSSKDYKIECGLLKNDSHVISGSANGCAVIWDFLEGKEVKQLNVCKNHSSVIQSLATHPSSEDILFTKRREIELWGPSDIEILEIEI